MFRIRLVHQGSFVSSLLARHSRLFQLLPRIIEPLGKINSFSNYACTNGSFAPRDPLLMPRRPNIEHRRTIHYKQYFSQLWNSSFSSSFESFFFCQWFHCSPLRQKMKCWTEHMAKTATLIDLLGNVAKRVRVFQPGCVVICSLWIALTSLIVRIFAQNHVQTPDRFFSGAYFVELFNVSNVRAIWLISQVQHFVQHPHYQIRFFRQIYCSCGLGHHQ